MRWFRSSIKRVSHVALFALAIQFALSFGHFHGVANQTASAAQSGSAQSGFLVANNLTAQVARNLSAPQPPSDRNSGEHPGDICAICAVMAMANVVMFATPPVVLLPQAVDFSPMATTVEFLRVVSVRLAFQPRAPPVS
jgi:hypothetical protein